MLIPQGTTVRVWDAQRVMLRVHVLKFQRLLTWENRVRSRGMFFQLTDGRRLFIDELEDEGWATFTTGVDRWPYILVKINA